MRIKICGMKYADNVREVGSLQPDFMGFIFYPASTRFVGYDFDENIVKAVPNGIRKVGVFVNESVENIIATAARFGIDFVQLHGNESAQYCQQLKHNGLSIIKAILMDATTDFTKLLAYQPWCSYFLFDTKTNGFGGSGQSFDWGILDSYKLPVPFFLSGGLGTENIEAALSIKHPMLYGLDINSKLESLPGMKEIEATNNIITKARKYERI